MKKGFLTKAFVAVGVMASALALSSVCAFAAEYTVSSTFNSTSKGKYYNLQATDTPTAEDSHTITAGDFYWIGGSNGDSAVALAEDKKVEFPDGKSYGSYVVAKSNGQAGAVAFYANAGETVKVYYKPKENDSKVVLTSTAPANASLSDTGDDVVSTQAPASKGKAVIFEATVESTGVYYFGDSAKKSEIYAVTTDTYKTFAKSDSGNTGVVFDGTDYYAVTVVNGTDVTADKTISVFDTPISTVYKSVQFDADHVYTAADFGGAASDYVYASQITGLEDTTLTQDEIVSAIKTNVTYTAE